jgi:competence protein ComEA
VLAVRTLITKRSLIVAGLSLFIGAILIATITSPTAAIEPVQDSAPELEPVPDQHQPSIRVEISGGVTSPGVIELPEGSRLIDAIAQAGGWGDRVDPLRVELCLNLAAPLEDGSAVRIPTRDDRLLLGLTGIECGRLFSTAAEIAVAELTGGSQQGPATGGKIDLNRATADQLDTLPGIGPVTAAKIIASRQEKPFIIVDDLLDRKIVSESVLEGIRALVTP